MILRFFGVAGAKKAIKDPLEKGGYKNADGGCFSFEMEPES